MSLRSMYRYRSYVLRARRGSYRDDRLLHLALNTPIGGDVWLRERGTDHDTFEEILVAEVYEPVAQRCTGCEYLLDIGANIGLASLYFAARYPGCKILGVEPDPGNFELLRRNTARLSEAGRFRAVRKAVWSADEPVALSGPPNGDQFNAITVAPCTSAGSGLSMVEGATVAQLIRESEFPRIDLLKVDVEGAEAYLFKGDVEWLERVYTIAIEFHGDSRAESGFDAQMHRFGFRIIDGYAHTVIAERSMK